MGKMTNQINIIGHSLVYSCMLSVDYYEEVLAKQMVHAYTCNRHLDSFNPIVSS